MKSNRLDSDFIAAFQSGMIQEHQSPISCASEIRREKRATEEAALMNCFNLFGFNSPPTWGEGWLKASSLKSVVNTPWLAAGCFI